MSKLGSLIAYLGLNTARFEAGISRAQKGLSRFSRRMRRQFRAMTRDARRFGTLIGGIFSIVAVKAATEAFVRQEQAIFQLEARLRSTGGAAGFSSDQLQGMARAIQKMTAFGDEAVIEMQSLLLTFTKIRGPIFKDAQMAVLNVATAMGIDLRSAAVQVGKALNDPVGQMSALSRQGIILSDSQKKLIKQLVEMGDIAGAQRIILQELSTEFGGSAKAAAEGLGGSISQLKNAFGDLLETLVKVTTNGGKSGLIQWLTSAIQWVNKWANRLPILFQSLFAQIDKFITSAKFAWKGFQSFIEFGWDKVIGTFTKSMGEAARVVAQAFAFIPGFGDISAKVDMFAQSLISAGESVLPLEERLARLNRQYEAEISIIDRTMQMLVAKQTAEEDAAAALENIAAIRGNARAVEVADARAHSDTLTAIEEMGAKRRVKINQFYERLKGKTLAQGMAAITNNVAQQSRTMFEINKAAAIANAVMNTSEAVTGAYKWGAQIGGPPLGAAMGALAFGAQIAQVNAIRSQSFGSGGTASPSITGSTGARDVVATVPATEGINIEEETNREIVLKVDGAELGRVVVDMAKDGRITIPQAAIEA